MAKISDDKAVNEFNALSEFLAVWIIFKAGEICGKITACYSKSHLITMTACTFPALNALLASASTQQTWSIASSTP